MRLVISTLLASSLRPHLQPRAPEPVLAADLAVELAVEEYEALAGVWRTQLELEDGEESTVSLHLAAPQALSCGAMGSYGGNVYPMDNPLPLSSCSMMSVSDAKWSADEDEKGRLCINMKLGNLQLEGRGERTGLRCSAFVGTVFEGTDDDACVVGRFNMKLSLPIKSDTTDLEERLAARLANRKPPPLTYARSGFVGSWRLLLTLDDEATPAYFPVELSPDGSWASVGSDQTLAGTWGMHAADSQAESGRLEEAGSRVWLSVQREKSSETLRGIAGLPGVNQDFHLSGKPVVETMEKELAARAAESAGGALAERVDGRLWEGNVERVYFGRFSLLRGDGAQLTEECHGGVAEACVALGREDEAKAAWLLAAPENPSVDEACESGYAVACAVQSREEQAKAEWLAKVDAEGIDEACELESREEEAKRAWLAKTAQGPSW